MKRNLAREHALLIGIFLASLVLRILAIDVPINVDEGLWMRRGPAFLVALLNGDLAGTYLRHHPGVPNMWLIGASMALRCLVRDQFPSTLGLDQAPSLLACSQILAGQPFFPISFYVVARVMQAVITSACMAGLYVLARQLLGRPIALGAIALLTFEPFFLAYQRSLTTDALQADFGTLALLLLLLYLRGDGPRRWLIASGVLMGFAVATKVLVLFALPAVALWITFMELGAWQPNLPRRGWVRQIGDMALWGAIILVVIFLIWPALWVAPGQTAQHFYADLLDEAEGHNQFFLGQFTRSPGPLFYPLVLAYRLSPVLQVGLLAGLAALLVPRLRQHVTHVPELIAIALIPLFVLGILSTNATKIDRYIVPITPPLALIAAAGWQEVSRGRLVKGSPLQRTLSSPFYPLLLRLGILPRAEKGQARYPSPHWAAGHATWLPREQGSRGAREQRGGGARENSPLRLCTSAPSLVCWFAHHGIAVALVLALAQLIFLIPHYPYYLTYHNPLLGGTRAAQRLLMIGNGEGLDRAARWLNQEPNAQTIITASWYSESFGPYYRGQTVDISAFNTWPWRTANRVIFYVNQFQRQIPEPKTIAYFAAQRPLYTVRLHGVDYVQVYPGPLPLPQDLDRIQTPLILTFDDQVRLLGYDLATPQVASGGDLTATFYWKFLATPPEDATIYVGLRDPQGNRWGHSDTAPVEGYLPPGYLSAGRVLRDAHRLTVLPGTPPGRYQIEIGWFSRAQGRAMEARNAAGNPQGTHVVIGEVEVKRPASLPSLESLVIGEWRNVDVGLLRLLGYDRLTEPFRAGEAFPLTLLWQRHQPGDAPFLLSLQLRQGDRVWQRQQPHPISEAYPPALWQVGEIVREQWQALLPAQVASGRYALSLLVADPDGKPVAEVPLGPIDIVARAHDFQSPIPQSPLQVTFGDSARLLGYDLVPRQAAPGATVTITLYWQALAETDTAYKVFVHFVDTGGQIRVQQDRPPLDGEAPTTGWISGEVLRDEYRITLPTDTPPGRYALRVGLYDPLTWQRLPVTAGDGGPDYIELGPVEVTP